jgi:VRR-NUC domain-containing protein
MKRPEQIIHKAVVAHLNARAEPRVFFWHTPNGGKRGIVEAKIFKALGVIAGVPDLIILKAGELYALELKASKGRITPAQNRVMDRLTDCGASVAIAHSIDEALITLEVWGILKRDSNRRVSETSLESQGT